MRKKRLINRKKGVKIRERHAKEQPKTYIMPESMRINVLDGLTLYEFMKAWWEGLEEFGAVECQECFKELQFRPHHCAHIVSRGSEIQMAYDTENMIPLCERCHTMFDSINRKMMAIWPWISKRIVFLKRKYNLDENDLEDFDTGNSGGDYRFDLLRRASIDPDNEPGSSTGIQ